MVLGAFRSPLSVIAAYLSVLDMKPVTQGADYWALGVLIYEMLTGETPYADYETNDVQKICKMIVQVECVRGIEVPRIGQVDLRYMVLLVLVWLSFF